MGGAIAAIEKGFVQKEIESRAYSIQKEIESKKRIIVGLNEFEVDESVDVALFKSDPELARKQQVKLEELKKRRDPEKVKSCLASIRKAAEGEDNLMPFFVEAVKTYATLGEICGVLREVFGEYQQIRTIG